MSAATHTLSFDGGLLEQGFWLYVWEITTPDSKTLCYVGRTGDSSSANAQSPFNRMGQHLGFNERANMLRHKLRARGVEPQVCTFRLVAYGPILPRGEDMSEHRTRRDVVAALELALALAMKAAGYDVINEVNCRKPLDKEMFAGVRSGFGPSFPKLAELGKARRPSLRRSTFAAVVRVGDGE